MAQGDITPATDTQAERAAVALQRIRAKRAAEYKAMMRTGFVRSCPLCGYSGEFAPVGTPPRVGQAALREFFAIGIAAGARLTLDGPVRCAADLAPSNTWLKELLFFDLLERGVYMAQRGLVSLSLPFDESACEEMLGAFEDAVRARRDIADHVRREAAFRQGDLWVQRLDHGLLDLGGERHVAGLPAGHVDAPQLATRPDDDLLAVRRPGKGRVDAMDGPGLLQIALQRPPDGLLATALQVLQEQQGLLHALGIAGAAHKGQVAAIGRRCRSHRAAGAADEGVSRTRPPLGY